MSAFISGRQYGAAAEKYTWHPPACLPGFGHDEKRD
jgi:hypothetical protein